MDNEFLNNKIAEAKRGAEIALLNAQKAMQEYFLKSGELLAYQNMLNLADGKIKTFTENQN